MLQPLVDTQEQEQQISQESPASVHSVPRINKNAQKKKHCESITDDAIVIQVNDNEELLLDQQEKSILAGNKNKNGLFDGVPKSVINSNDQAWSVTDNNTHEPDLKEMLTGNCNLNGIEQQNSNVKCSFLNQNIHTAICKHNEQCIS